MNAQQLVLEPDQGDGKRALVPIAQLLRRYVFVGQRLLMDLL
jgi:hypothetical protein